MFSMQFQIFAAFRLLENASYTSAKRMGVSRSHYTVVLLVGLLVGVYQNVCGERTISTVVDRLP